MEIPCYQEQGILSRNREFCGRGQQLVWEVKVKGLLMSELKRRNVTYAQFVENRRQSKTWT